MGYHFSAYYEFMNKSVMSGDIIPDLSSNGSVNSSGDVKAIAPPSQDSTEGKRTLRPRKTATGEKAD